MTNKMYFISAIEKLLKLDDRNTVDALTYTRNDVDGGFPEEAVVISYEGGHNVVINVSGNSNLVNLKEIVKEVSGEGAQGKLFTYTL
jgi:hypothetical protein